jgi:Rrf2 family protein
MLHLALHGQGRPVPVADIAAREGISQKYLQQLLGTMKRAGLARVVLGPHGGFELARAPSEITIGALLRAAEGDIALMECLMHEGLCSRSAECPSRRVWASASEVLNDFLEAQTLATALEGTEASSLATKPEAAPRAGKRRSCP